MANLTFPNNPVNGQTYEFNGKLFRYDSTTTRWSATRAQVLGALPDDIVIETPDLTLDNTAISFSESGTTVYVHYTVSDDVSVSIANNGLADSTYATATLSRSNNTITITSGTEEFSSANVVVTATNNRTSNTASINLSAAYVISWTVTGATLASGSLTSISTSTNPMYSNMENMEWSKDGNYLFVTVNNTDAVFRYDQSSTPFEISSFTYAGYDQSYSVRTNSNGPLQTIFSDDGLTMLVTSQTGNCTQYNLTNAFDITTASYVGVLSGFDATYKYIAVKPDGTEIYWWIDGSSSEATGTFKQVTLSTPWDLSTAGTPVSQNTEGIAWENLQAIEITADGDRLFLLQQDGSNLLTYVLSTPWDITSIASTPSETISNPFGTLSSPTTMRFTSNGQYLYINNKGDDTLKRITTGL